MDIPSSCQTARQKAAAAEQVYLKLARFVEDDIAAILPATNELHAKYTQLCGIHVTSRELASMSKGKCKEILLLACKLIGNQDRMLGLRNAKNVAEAQRLKAKDTHEKLFYGAALKADQALRHATELLSQLHREMEEKTKQFADLNEAIRVATDRLGIARDTTSKPVTADRKEPKLPPQLESAIANAKQIIDSERKKTKRLQEQVKYFKKKLDAYREPDSSEEIKDLQAPLEAYKTEGWSTAC